MRAIGIIDAKCNAVGCRYDAVDYLMISQNALHWQQLDINLPLNSQNIPLILPWWASYGVSLVKFREKIEHMCCDR